MPKILIIEDDLILREGIADVLKEKGFEVTKAEDGKKGIEMVMSDTFDVIISDLRTPTMTALSLLNQLGDLAKGGSIIVITGHGSELTDEKSKEIGVAACLKKPFSSEHMLSVIDDILKKKKSGT